MRERWGQLVEWMIKEIPMVALDMDEFLQLVEREGASTIEAEAQRTYWRGTGWADPERNYEYTTAYTAKVPKKRPIHYSERYGGRRRHYPSYENQTSRRI